MGCGGVPGPELTIIIDLFAPPPPPLNLIYVFFYPPETPAEHWPTPNLLASIYFKTGIYFQRTTSTAAFTW